MPRAKCLFRRTDATRAVRAVELATGKPVARVEIDNTGKIIVFPSRDDGEARTETMLRGHNAQ
jgi:hypothetical protein